MPGTKRKYQLFDSGTRNEEMKSGCEIEMLITSKRKRKRKKNKRMRMRMKMKRRRIVDDLRENLTSSIERSSACPSIHYMRNAREVLLMQALGYDCTLHIMMRERYER